MKGLKVKKAAAALSIFIGMPAAFATQNNLEFSQICEMSSHNCIKDSKKYLEEVPFQSRLWYKLKLLELDALFNLQQLEELHQEVEQWADKDNLPITFEVYILIYRAKLSFGKTSPEITQQYLDKALITLSNIHEMVPRPMRLIEIANLQNANDQPEKAKQTLLTLEEKFSRNASPLFKRELYGNLGHAAVSLNQLDEHVIYREKSLDGALQVGNVQQIGIAGYNLGRAYQLQNRLNDALVTFEKSANDAKKANDKTTAINATMRVIEVNFLKGNKDKAHRLFQQLQQTQSNIPQSLSKRYAELKKLLTL